MVVYGRNVGVVCYFALVLVGKLHAQGHKTGGVISILRQDYAFGFHALIAIGRLVYYSDYILAVKGFP